MYVSYSTQNVVPHFPTKIQYSLNKDIPIFFLHQMKLKSKIDEDY